jgi:hypothetical protein
VEFVILHLLNRDGESIQTQIWQRFSVYVTCDLDIHQGDYFFVQRLKLLNQAWSELKQMAATRGQKLDESLTYQQFLAKVEEEEAWIR